MNRQGKAGHQEENCFTVLYTLLTFKARLITVTLIDFLHFDNFFYSKIYFLPISTRRHRIHCYKHGAHIHGGINDWRYKCMEA